MLRIDASRAQQLVEQRKIAIATKEKDERLRARRLRAQQLKTKKIAAATEKAVRDIINSLEALALAGHTRTLLRSQWVSFCDALDELGFKRETILDQNRAEQKREINLQIKVARGELDRINGDADEALAALSQRSASLFEECRKIVGVGDRMPFKWGHAPLARSDADEFESAVQSVTRLLTRLQNTTEIEHLRTHSATIEFSASPLHYQERIQSEIRRAEAHHERSLQTRGTSSRRIRELVSIAADLRSEWELEINATSRKIENLHHTIENHKHRLKELESKGDANIWLDWSAYSQAASSEFKRINWLCTRSQTLFTALDRSVQDVASNKGQKAINIEFGCGAVRIGSTAIKIPQYVDAEWLLTLIHRQHGFGFELAAPRQKDGLQKAQILW